MNEPHVTQSHRDFKNYNLSIEYKNIEIAVCEILLKNPTIYYSFFEMFEEYMIEHFKRNVDKLIEFCKERENIEQIVPVSLYHMNTRINYRKMVEKLLQCKAEKC